MPGTPRRTRSFPSGSDPRRRVEVLSTLLAICRSLERMQTSPEARTACREVQAQLAGLRKRERQGARETSR